MKTRPRKSRGRAGGPAGPGWCWSAPNDLGHGRQVGHRFFDELGGDFDRATRPPECEDWREMVTSWREARRPATKWPK